MENAGLLNISVGSPFLEVIRQVYLSDGIPFEYAIDLWRGDRIKFSIDDFYQEEKTQFKIKTGDRILD